MSKVQSSRLEKSEFLQAIDFCESSQLEACLKLCFIVGMHMTFPNVHRNLFLPIRHAWVFVRSLCCERAVAKRASRRERN